MIFTSVYDIDLYLYKFMTIKTIQKLFLVSRNIKENMNDKFVDNIKKTLSNHLYCYRYDLSEIVILFLNDKQYTISDDYLHFCCEWGALNVIKLLILTGSDAKGYNNRAIRWAAQYGYLEVIKYLLGQGSDINDLNNDALKRAIMYGRTEVVKYLTSIGCNINKDNIDNI